jgi:hypothetical protein
MMDFSAAPKLDPREQHFRIPGTREGLLLFLRFLPAADTEFRPRRAALYVALWRERINFLGGDDIAPVPS